MLRRQHHGYYDSGHPKGSRNPGHGGRSGCRQSPGRDRKDPEPAGREGILVFFTELVCGLCGQPHSKSQLQTVCRVCGRPLLAMYDLSAVSTILRKEDLAGRDSSLWRYREILPLPLDEEPVTLSEGWTPLLPAHRFGEKI